MVAVLAVTAIRFLASFGSQIVLVRFLAPEVFGEFAFLAIVHGAIGMFRSLRGGEYLVRLDDENLDRERDPVFTVEITIGIVMAIATFLLARPLLTAVGRPTLTPYLQVMAAHFLLTGLAIPGSILQRRLQFWRLQASALTGAILRPGLKVVLVLSGWELYGLILGDLIGFAIELVILWIVARVRLRLRFDRTVARQLAIFGGPLVLAQFIAFYYWKIDDLLVAEMVGLEALGFYFLAFRIPEYFMQIKIASSPVAYASLSALRNRAERRRGFEILTRYTFVATAVVTLPTVLYAREMIVVLFSEKWVEATAPFQILMIAAAVRMTLGYSADLVQVSGKTWILLAATAFNGVVLSISAFLLTREPYGITGTAIAVALTVATSVPVSVWIARHFVEARFLPILWRPTVALALATGAGLLVRAGLPLSADGPLGLAVHGTLVAAVALVLFVAIDRALWGDFRALRPTPEE